jgi:hypothetical protein
MKSRLFLFLACFYVFIAGRHGPRVDARLMYETTKAVIDEGRLNLTFGADPVRFVWRDGKAYAINSPANSIAMIPSYLAFKAVRLIPGMPEHPFYELTAVLSPALLVALAGALFFELARRQGASVRAALWTALAFGTTTVVVPYAKSQYSEALQTFALLWVVERTTTLTAIWSRGRAVLLGVAGGVLLASKPVYPIVVPVVAIMVAHGLSWNPRLIARTALWVALGAAPFLATILAWNAVRTGSFLNSGYDTEGAFTGKIVVGLHGLLFSPSRAVWLFSPLIVLGLLGFPSLYARQRARALFYLAISGVLLLLYAKFRDWHGMGSWGPRYLVPVTALLCLPAAGRDLAAGRADARPGLAPARRGGAGTGGRASDAGARRVFTLVRHPAHHRGLHSRRLYRRDQGQGPLHPGVLAAIGERLAAVERRAREGPARPGLEADRERRERHRGLQEIPRRLVGDGPPQDTAGAGGGHPFSPAARRRRCLVARRPRAPGARFALALMRLRRTPLRGGVES